MLFSGGILECVPSEFTETLKTAVHTNYLAILLLFMYGPILIVNIFHINCNNEVNALLSKPMIQSIASSNLRYAK
jgi:hypothetical protein